MTFQHVVRILSSCIILPAAAWDLGALSDKIFNVAVADSVLQDHISAREKAKRCSRLSEKCQSNISKLAGQITFANCFKLLVFISVFTSVD